MKRILHKIAVFLGLAKRKDTHTIWAIIFKRKAEFVNDNEVGETYICSSPFGTEYEAMRHEESLKQELMGFDIIDIVPIETKEQVSVARYNYTISEEHPKVTVEYEEL